MKRYEGVWIMDSYPDGYEADASALFTKRSKVSK